jgi:flagellar hook-associated protein 2
MPTITFGGIGSGIDTESIISGLVNASKGPLNRVQEQGQATQSAISSMSDIGNLLSKFKDAVQALDSVQEVGSFSATSSDKSVVASAAGGAAPGSFEVEVTQLASAYKSYSDVLAITAPGQALEKSGTLSLTIGDKTVDLAIDGDDTLDQVMQKINTSGLRVSASSFFDGTGYRLQLRGLDSGDDNNVNVVETGTNFGFTKTENLKSTGQDAIAFIDGFKVTSKTNQITGAIAGVTLALTAETEAGKPTSVSVASDSAGFQTKLKTLVDSYNAVVNKIHTEAGFGSVKASNAQLRGDSTLRGITSSLSNTLTQTVGDGKFTTLRSIGLELNNNGTLKLNTSTLEKALAEDPSAVTRVLAGDDDQTQGLADKLSTLATDLLSAKGSLQARKDGLTARQKLLTDRADAEQRRLDRMEEALRKQFTQMDQAVSAAKAQGNSL